MFVGAQIVNPELICPRLFSANSFIKEENIRFDSLRIEDSGGKPQECMDIGLLQDAASNCLAGAAFKENVVGNYNRRSAISL